jgi:hypothetical protein
MRTATTLIIWLLSFGISKAIKILLPSSSARYFVVFNHLINILIHIYIYKIEKKSYIIYICRPRTWGASYWIVAMEQYGQLHHPQAGLCP